MNASFAEIAKLMDPLQPLSLRELGDRHRWPGGNPPANLSLRVILDRHGHPMTSRSQFLWYNTFLLHGFEISLCNLLVLDRLASKLGFDPRDILKQMGITPAQIVDVMQISKRALVDGVGISLDSLKNAFASVVDALASALTFGLVDIGLDDILDKISIQDLLDRYSNIITVDKLLDTFSIDPLELLVKFCGPTLDFISHYSGVPLNMSVHVKEKPEREARATEIGRAIATEYDIVAFCEVFESSRVSAIVAAVRAVRGRVDAETGPDQGSELASSGLLTLALGEHRIVRAERISFEHKGEPLRDADAWSNKGVLCTVVDLGLGKIEIFSTHLLAGEGVPVEEWLFKSTAGATTYERYKNADIFSTQLAQLDELVRFFNQQHDPRNVAIIVGDLNIDAHDPTQYEGLIARMHAIGMLDLWPYHRHRVMPSVKDAQEGLRGEPIPRGDTHASKEGEMSSDVERVCKLLDPEPASGKVYCDENAQTGATGRIDYVFIENPRDEHTFMLDVTRLRRRPFPRSSATAGQERFLSDHLGLDLVMIASPR